jgi:hypothetical protein
LLLEIEYLYLKAETTPLSETESCMMREALDKIASLRRDEEKKWAQRAEVKHV